MIEHNHASDCRPNGMAERAARSVGEAVRLLNLDIENGTGERLGVSSLEHVCGALNKCNVSQDGKTSDEMLKGKTLLGQMLPFGASHASCCRGGAGRCDDREIVSRHLSGNVIPYTRA